MSVVWGIFNVHDIKGPTPFQVLFNFTDTRK
jgi:hypothetical protein